MLPPAEATFAIEVMLPWQAVQVGELTWRNRNGSVVAMLQSQAWK
jgi:hypothetical protein